MKASAARGHSTSFFFRPWTFKVLLDKLPKPSDFNNLAFKLSRNAHAHTNASHFFHPTGRCRLETQHVLFLATMSWARKDHVYSTAAEGAHITSYPKCSNMTSAIFSRLYLGLKGASVLWCGWGETDTV